MPFAPNAVPVRKFGSRSTGERKRIAEILIRRPARDHNQPRRSFGCASLNMPKIIQHVVAKATGWIPKEQKCSLTSEMSQVYNISEDASELQSRRVIAGSDHGERWQRALRRYGELTAHCTSDQTLDGIGTHCDRAADMPIDPNDDSPWSTVAAVCLSHLIVVLNNDLRYGSGVGLVGVVSSAADQEKRRIARQRAGFAKWRGPGESAAQGPQPGSENTRRSGISSTQ